MDAARISRTRIGVAVGLVAALAIGLAVTSHSSHDHPRAGAAAGVASRKVASVKVPAAAPPSTVISERRADDLRRLQALIPDHSECGYDPNADIPDLECTRDGVLADYFLLSAERVNSSYVNVASAIPRHSRSGPSPCASGREDERGWAMAGHPQVAVGRVSCRVENGVPTMWWTVPRRGLIARAVMTKGTLAQLFEWWNSHSERWAG